MLGDGEINTADLARVLAVKHEVMGGAEVLRFEHDLPTLDQVAGMAGLKRWLKVRRRTLPAARRTGLPAPRGVLLLGVQGAGKSLAAKAIAASWQVPLFRMDFGALYDKWQGESERKLREALRVADAMQPCVLWMDEIEKGLAGGSSSEGDSTGAGTRMLGSLLTWMSERRSSVFLAATGTTSRPCRPSWCARAASTRSSRRPAHRGRAWRHLPHPPGAPRHRGRRAGAGPAGAGSVGYSGAEIEAAIVGARYEAHGTGHAPHAHGVLAELARTKPLSVTRAEAIARLRAWAADRTVGVE